MAWFSGSYTRWLASQLGIPFPSSGLGSVSGKPRFKDLEISDDDLTPAVCEGTSVNLDPTLVSFLDYWRTKGDLNPAVLRPMT